MQLNYNLLVASALVAAPIALGALYSWHNAPHRTTAQRVASTSIFLAAAGVFAALSLSGYPLLALIALVAIYAGPERLWVTRGEFWARVESATWSRLTVTLENGRRLEDVPAPKGRRVWPGKSVRVLVHDSAICGWYLSAEVLADP